MKHRQQPPTWKRTVKLSAAATAAGVLVGAGGTTLALWNTGLDFSATAHSGYEYFAAGHPGLTEAATDGTVSIPIGPKTAATLQEERAVAIALETQSISQGNMGLRYEIQEPNWGDNVFGAADTTLFRVSSAAECTVDNAPGDSGSATSTPVDAAYSGNDEPVVEYWCLVAVVDEFADEGTHSGSVTATAQDPADTSVEATDEWHAKVTSEVEASDEPEHRLTIRYETFRPSVDDS